MDSMRILGIDPGSATTGYGVVVRERGTVAHVAHGTIQPRQGISLPERLAAIQRDLRAVVEEYEPDSAVVERVFVSANVRSALVLGQARGAILATLGAAGVPVDELSAREIKKAVTGSGAADKTQIQAMVVRLLGLERAPVTDAADALAAAICRAQMGRLGALDIAPRSRRRRRLAAPPPGRTYS
jgi:crossover junction endodeoxyribonuclease RuvC